ncbi:MAG: histidine kinase, partial [Allomuricauda sp.]
MAKYFKNLSFVFFFAFILGVTAQTTESEEVSALKEFQSANSSSNRFKTFFNTIDRYGVNSAYDWLDTIKIYLSNAQKTNDTIATRLYMVMQTQVYNDLGEYDKSTALAKELHMLKDSLDTASRKIVLDILDDNYAHLQLYDKQIEIRKEKRELDFTDNVAFYDIYSNLGLHREARNQYIMEVRPTIADNENFKLAKYHNKIGTYLRLDNSAPTALSEYKKANGHLDVFINNISIQKTEEELFESDLLKAEIEGNIGKCHVQLGEFEEAIPLLENSIEALSSASQIHYKNEVIENTLNLADANLQLENYLAAKRSLDSEFEHINLLQTIKRNSLLAAYYDKIENYRNAATYYKRNERIKDSLAQKQSTIIKQQLVTIVANEDMENSRSLIEEQRRINEEAREEMKAKDERINLVFISLIFTLLGFAGLVYAYLKSIKNQRLIAEQKHIIENA